MNFSDIIKVDSGFVNIKEIKWIEHIPENDCFEICVKSTGCLTNKKQKELGNKDTWSVCKKNSKDIYNFFLEKTKLQ